MKHTGGNETKGGFYWKKGAWEIVTVEGKTGILPGGEDAQYVRVPGILVLPVALLLSIAYVVFLPVVGFAMLFGALFGKVGRAVARKTVPEGPAEKEAPAGRTR